MSQGRGHQIKRRSRFNCDFSRNGRTAGIPEVSLVSMGFSITHRMSKPRTSSRHWDGRGEHFPPIGGMLITAICVIKPSENPWKRRRELAVTERSPGFFWVNADRGSPLAWVRGNKKVADRGPFSPGSTFHETAAHRVALTSPSRRRRAIEAKPQLRLCLARRALETR